MSPDATEDQRVSLAFVGHTVRQRYTRFPDSFHPP